MRDIEKAIRDFETAGVLLTAGDLQQLYDLSVTAGDSPGWQIWKSLVNGFKAGYMIGRAEKGR